ncbi:hypothetical protein JHK85_032393 [Glycine max]|nr:hypothetical protein JHK85_032393 [Glycine max]
MKTKARNINTNNIVSETKQRAPYQDDELVELQEVLEVNPDVINESLADVDGGGEEIDASLLKQLDLVELDEDECILSENDIEMNMKEKISDLFWCRKHVSTEVEVVVVERGFSLGAPITTNPSTSSIHISTLKQPTYGCSNIISNIIKAKFDEPTTSWLKVSVDLRDRWFGEFKSSTTKANRSVDRGASAYCGGSISITAHFEKLSKEFQRPPTAWEVMEKTKKLKSGEWVNDKSREFASIIPAPSLSPTIADGTEHHANDAQVDRPYDMGNNH